MNLKSKSNLYTDPCLKYFFKNRAISRKAPRRTVVNSARGSATGKPEICIRYRPFSDRSQCFFQGRIAITP